MNPYAQIEIVDTLTQNPAATITPSTYKNDWQIIAKNDYTAENYSKFTLTQNSETTDSYRWKITEDGVLIEEEIGNISIKVCDEESDVNVEQTNSGDICTFVSADGYDSYEWEVDGKVISSGTSYAGVSLSGNSLVCDTSTWVKGVYDIFLTAKKMETETNVELEYSYHVQIIKN